MSAELGVGFGIKIFGGAFLALISGMFTHIYWALKRDKTKLDNTYTKKEVHDHVDLKLKPYDVKFDGLDKQLDVLAVLIKESIEKGDLDRGKNKEAISDIKTDIAVIINKLDNQKENS